MKQIPHPDLRAAILGWVIAALTWGLCTTPIPARAQGEPTPGSRPARLAGPWRIKGDDSSPRTTTTQSLSFSIDAQSRTLVDAWTSYDPTTCLSRTSGSWTVTTPPRRGGTTTATVMAPLDNGECPGKRFPFAALYYTWTSPDAQGITDDEFTAKWSGSGESTLDLVDLTLIAPARWTQVGRGVAMPDGVLHFDYTWQSTTGALDDLAQCQVGEYVGYPGYANPYVWPRPPYIGTSANPAVIWLPATEGQAEDNHTHVPFAKTYLPSSVLAFQSYRYRCAHLATVDFSGYSHIAILRDVLDSTGRRCWGYTIMKSNDSASIPMLPGVDPDLCTPTAEREMASVIVPADHSFRASPGPLLAVQGSSFTRVLHAPVFVDLTVKNPRAEPMSIDLGLNRRANLALIIDDPSGQRLRRTLERGGFGASGRRTLAPGSAFNERLVLNEWHDFADEGRYRISMILEGGGFQVNPSVDFTVDIGARDPEVLALTARQLADIATNGVSIARRMDAALALGTIRDPVAIPALVRVLEHGALVQSYAVDGLGHIGTPQAIAELAKVADHPDEEVRSRAQYWLARLRDGVAP